MGIRSRLTENIQCITENYNLTWKLPFILLAKKQTNFVMLHILNSILIIGHKNVEIGAPNTSDTSEKTNENC